MFFSLLVIWVVWLVIVLRVVSVLIVVFCQSWLFVCVILFMLFGFLVFLVGVDNSVVND